MILSDLTIEDIVYEDDSAWSQVCEQCAKILDYDNCNEQIPLDKYICGIENCQNIAKYYLELEIFNSNKNEL